MPKKIRICINIDESVARETKKIAGLVPFSRFVEDLLSNQIKKEGEE